jgi:hypothetical protein
MPDTDDGAINVVLRYLRAIERKVDRLIDNNQDVLARVPALEASRALVLDRMETRLDRIERRFQLKHGPADLRGKRRTDVGATSVPVRVQPL